MGFPMFLLYVYGIKWAYSPNIVRIKFDQYRAQYNSIRLFIKQAMPLYILVVILEFKKALNNDLGSIKQNRDGTISAYSLLDSSLNIGIQPSYYYYAFFNTTTSLLTIADYNFSFDTSNSTSTIRIFKRGSLLTIFYFKVLIYFNIDYITKISLPFYPRNDYSIYNIVVYSSAVIRLIYEYKLNCI